MIDLTRTLLNKGFAYEKLHSVYFDISRFKGYGHLSRVDLKKIQVGKTVDLDEYEKDNPRDFTLLKRSNLAELKKGIFFPTEWGNVRPGWHIECSAMALKHLGETFDIHTSGVDLTFPHHENEIAISEAATGKKFVNYWLHSEMVTVDGKKMSWASGNYITLRNILEQGFTGREVRYWLLATHYRKPLAFSLPSLKASRRALQRLDEFIQKLYTSQREPKDSLEVDDAIHLFKNQFNEALDDDLNIAQALSALYKLVRTINPVLTEKRISEAEFKELDRVLRKVNSVLQVIDFPEQALPLEVEDLLAQREKARQRKAFDEADRLRDQICARGYRLIDLKDKTLCTQCEKREPQCPE
jgi:cysteinyl-tRNA synthetase